MARCPICDRETAPEFRPFCSRRCADIDLARWMTGAYAVAAEEEDTPDRAPEPDREAPSAPPTDRPH